MVVSHHPLSLGQGIFSYGRLLRHHAAVLAHSPFGEEIVDRQPGCERMSPAEATLAVLAAVEPERVLDWLEAETIKQLGLQPGAGDDVVLARPN